MSASMHYRVSTVLIFALCLHVRAHGVELAKNTQKDFGGRAGNIAELFAGIDADLIDVKFIAQDASKANVLLQNNTDRVLHIQLPNAFAAVPVLAQFGPGGGQNGGFDMFGQGGGGGGNTQGVGGGFNMGQGQGLGQGFGQQGFGQGQGQGFRFGGLMRIPPGKTRKLKATTVCLEHGKPEPNPRLAYRIIPIKQFTSDQRVADLCSKLAQGKVSQDVAQAAAWHLSNGLSWERLVGLNRIESPYLGKIPYFSAAELDKARKLVGSLTAKVAAEDRYARASK